MYLYFKNKFSVPSCKRGGEKGEAPCQMCEAEVGMQVINYRLIIKLSIVKNKSCSVFNAFGSTGG